jgi:carbamoyltransferase
MRILGIAGFYHDSSACLLEDGEILGYAEEERFNRKKHTPDFPHLAIDWLLKDRRISLDEVDEVVFYMNPWGYLRTGITAALANFPRSLRLASRNAATVPPLSRLVSFLKLKGMLCEKHNARGDFKLVFVDHYRTHQAGAFYASGFDEAAILTMDAAADGTTEVVALGKGVDIEDRLVHNVPHSFAIIFATVTHLLGFKWYDEFKVMGMAAYGKPEQVEKVEKLYRLEPDGRFGLDLSYFDFQNYGMARLYSPKLVELLGEPRAPGTPITQREYDLAASLQAATTRYGLKLARLARDLTGSKNLCMAGGVAQNCLMNQAICESGLFENVFLQPLASDSGGSLGAALYRYHEGLRRPRKYVMKHLYLGPQYAEESSRDAAAAGLTARPAPDWHRTVAQEIADGLVIGYFGGRMEAGPRALGARSILADPRRTDMKDILNARVKHREHFRPFAPSVLAEEVDEVFEPLPACRSLEYMIVTMNVRPEWRARVPAISHNDGTARVQAVHESISPDYYRIIKAFKSITGVPLVVNTSFNDNEPVVCKPVDAINCFKRTNIDLLVMEGRLYYREDNKHAVQKVSEAA